VTLAGEALGLGGSLSRSQPLLGIIQRV